MLKRLILLQAFVQMYAGNTSVISDVTSVHDVNGGARGLMGMFAVGSASRFGPSIFDKAAEKARQEAERVRQEAERVAEKARQEAEQEAERVAEKARQEAEVIMMQVEIMIKDLSKNGHDMQLDSEKMLGIVLQNVEKIQEVLQKKPVDVSKIDEMMKKVIASVESMESIVVEIVKVVEAAKEAMTEIGAVTPATHEEFRKLEESARIVQVNIVEAKELIERIAVEDASEAERMRQEAEQEAEKVAERVRQEAERAAEGVSEMERSAVEVEKVVAEGVSEAERMRQEAEERAVEGVSEMERSAVEDASEMKRAAAKGTDDSVKEVERLVKSVEQSTHENQKDAEKLLKAVQSMVKTIGDVLNVKPIDIKIAEEMLVKAIGNVESAEKEAEEAVKAVIAAEEAIKSVNATNIMKKSLEKAVEYRDEAVKAAVEARRLVEMIRKQIEDAKKAIEEVIDETVFPIPVVNVEKGLIPFTMQFNGNEAQVKIMPEAGEKGEFQEYKLIIDKSNSDNVGVNDNTDTNNTDMTNNSVTVSGEEFVNLGMQVNSDSDSMIARISRAIFPESKEINSSDMTRRFFDILYVGLMAYRAYSTAMNTLNLIDLTVRVTRDGMQLLRDGIPVARRMLNTAGNIHTGYDWGTAAADAVASVGFTVMGGPLLYPAIRFIGSRVTARVADRRLNTAAVQLVNRFASHVVSAIQPTTVVNAVYGAISGLGRSVGFNVMESAATYLANAAVRSLL